MENKYKPKGLTKKEHDDTVKWLKDHTSKDGGHYPDDVKSNMYADNPIDENKKEKHMKITESQLRKIIQEALSVIKENDFDKGKINPFQSPEVKKAIRQRQVRQELEKNPQSNNVKPSEIPADFNPRKGKEHINNNVKLNKSKLDKIISESIKNTLNENRIMDFFRNFFMKTSQNANSQNQLIGIAYEIYKEMAGRYYYGDEMYDHLDELINDYDIASPADKKYIFDAVCKALNAANNNGISRR